MDELGGHFDKRHKSEEDKYCMISLKCGTSKIIQMNLYTKQKQIQRHKKHTYGYQQGKEGSSRLEGWD